MAAKVAGLCSKGLWLSSFRAAGGEGEQIAGRSQTPAGRSVLGIATSAHSWFHTTAAAQRFAASRTEPCRVQRQGGKGNADPQRLAEYRAQLMRCWTGEGEDGTLIGQLERAGALKQRALSQGVTSSAGLPAHRRRSDCMQMARVHKLGGAAGTVARS